MVATQFRGVRGELVLKTKRRIAGALRVVLVCDRRAEQRHDAVAGELVDGALEAVDALAQDREEALQDPSPFLGVASLGQLHRTHHVREEDGDLLALALERFAPRADLLREVVRSQRAWIGSGGCAARLRGGRSTVNGE